MITSILVGSLVPLMLGLWYVLYYRPKLNAKKGNASKSGDGQ